MAIRKRTVWIIGVQMDLGSFRKGVDMGPLAIRHAGLVQKIKDIGYTVIDRGDIVPLVATYEGNPRLRYEKEINDANIRLYREVNRCISSNAFPIVLGGDHSIAAGSIAGSLKNHKSIGVIWIDAHGDFNDESITPSGNMHGMPLSAVSGCGPDCMVSFEKRRVDPGKIVIVGARALDPLEIIKLKDKGVTVISISEIHSIGMLAAIKKAIDIAGDGTEGIHLSFDMDALDPTQAPGVGTPVLNGMTQREAFIACEMVSKSGKLIALDVVETNPLLDKKNMTGILASELILACLGNTNY